MSLNKGVMMMACGGEKLITFYAKVNGLSTEAFRAKPESTWSEWIGSKYCSNYESDNGIGGVFVVKNGKVYLDMVDGSGRTHGILRQDEGLSEEVYDYYQIIEGNTYVATCYIKGTFITLADGSTKLVEELTYDDELLVWDFDNGCFAKAKALWITKACTTNHYYRLRFSDDTELCLVGSEGKCHRLLNIENGEFTYGSYFRIGQHTFKDDSSTPYLVSIELIEEGVEFYNVATHYHMNCFVNGILSSTGYNNMYPIKDMKFIKDDRELIPFETYVDVPLEFYRSLRLGEQDLSKRSVEKAKKYIALKRSLMV